MLAFLLACADPTLVDVPPAVQVSPATFAGLAVEQADDLAQRTLVERSGALRFADAGPVAVGGDAEARWDSLPVVEADSGVRVVVEESGLRLLPWLDREDLRLVVAETTWIGADGHRAADGAPGVQIRGGDLVNLEGEAASVDAMGPSVEFDLPIADGLLDEVSLRAPLSAALPVDGYVLQPAEVTDDAGAVLAEATGELGGWAVHVIRRAGDRVLVEGSVDSVCGWEPLARVRGWVPVAALGEPELFFGYGGCCCCGGFGSYGWGRSGPRVDLQPDQLLYDAPDGDIVGVVTRPTTRGIDRDAGELDGWTAIVAETRWGPATVWVAEAGPTLPDLTAPDDATPASHVPAAEAEARAQAEMEARLDALQAAVAAAGNDADAIERVLADFDQRE